MLDSIVKALGCTFIALCLVAAVQGVHAAEPINPDEPWCLMAQEPDELAPLCLRTFKTYGWCMFDLKTTVDEYHLVAITFSCHLEYVRRPIARR